MSELKALCSGLHQVSMDALWSLSSLKLMQICAVQRQILMHTDFAGTSAGCHTSVCCRKAGQHTLSKPRKDAETTAPCNM